MRIYLAVITFWSLFQLLFNLCLVLPFITGHWFVLMLIISFTYWLRLILSWHCSMSKYSTARPIPSRCLLCWTIQCSNLNQKNFFLKKTRWLVSYDYRIKYKRTSDKFRQVVRDSKRWFWDAMCQNARAPCLQHKIFWRIKNRSSAPLGLHLVLQQADSVQRWLYKLSIWWITLVRTANMNLSISHMGLMIACPQLSLHISLIKRCYWS